MVKIKKYLNWECILLLGVHVLWADGTIIIGSYLTFSVLMFYSGLDSTNPVLMTILSLFVPVLIMLKPLGLPLTYSFLSKVSKNEMILNFIQNLKENGKFQKKILLIAFLPTIIFYIYFLIYNTVVGHEHVFRDCTLLMIFLGLFINIFGSYLVLFLWWKIQDKFKKTKNIE